MGMVKNTRAVLSNFSLAILLFVICGCRGLATYQPPAVDSPSSPAGTPAATQWKAGPFSTLNATPYGWDYATFLGGGGTDLDVGLRAFIERTHDPIDLLVIVSDCHTTWSNDVPPFPVITIRVGDGAPPPWGNRRGNTVISIEDRRG